MIGEANTKKERRAKALFFLRFPFRENGIDTARKVPDNTGEKQKKENRLMEIDSGTVASIGVALCMLCALVVLIISDLRWRAEEGER